MPFSKIAGPEIVMESYSKWHGHDCLVIVDNNTGIVDQICTFTRDSYHLEKELIDRLLQFRRCLTCAVHSLDSIAMNAAIADCIRQIDKQRMRQRKRRETVP